MLLGKGNDHLTITSTLVPGLDHNPDGTLGTLVAVHGGITTVHGGGNSLLSITGTFTVSGHTSHARQRVVGGRRLRDRPADHPQTASRSERSPESCEQLDSPSPAPCRRSPRAPSPCSTRRPARRGSAATRSRSPAAQAPTRRSSSTATPRRTASGTAATRTSSRSATSAPKPLPEPDRERHAALLLLPGREPVQARRQRRHRRQPALRRALRRRPADTSASPRYGGAGDDLIYGSQAGDFLAGGSGDDTIVGGAASTRSTATPASTSTSSAASSSSRPPTRALRRTRDDLVAGKDTLVRRLPGLDIAGYTPGRFVDR